MVLKNTVLKKYILFQGNLASEAVQGPSLALQGIHHIQGSDSLTTSMLSVGHSIADDILQEDLQDSTGLLIDQTADALDTSTTSQTANSRFGDTLDVITKDLAVTFSTSLSQTLASFTTSRHLQFK
jgi:hypothetical protein